MIAVVSHDAGGAELLSSFVRQSESDCVFSLAGPARKVFERKLGSVPEAELDDAIARASSLLCGTSWQSDLECRAIDAARQAGKRSVAFLDHWVNYRERFERAGSNHLPDEIWVGDEMALRMARGIFSGLPVVLVPNPYFADLQAELRIAASSQRERAPDDALRVLYVCEPVAEHGLLRFGNERHWGYTEFDALEYFLDHLQVLGDRPVRVSLRPHPAEPAGKYDLFVKQGVADVAVGGKQPLLDEVAACDVVAGCNSMAMVVGLLAGKRVISVIPPGGVPCTLPHAEIERLPALLARSKASAQ